ncbi:MAG: hypothetical protein QY311_00145 [Candidatus Paceibacterota bacterium]|nr:MAG: hypothetical protein QY311_00145 [Candidatus Paceibacterota bacterium]
MPVGPKYVVGGKVLISNAHPSIIGRIGVGPHPIVKILPTTNATLGEERQVVIHNDAHGKFIFFEREVAPAP